MGIVRYVSARIGLWFAHKKPKDDAMGLISYVSLLRHNWPLVCAKTLKMAYGSTLII